MKPYTCACGAELHDLFRQVVRLNAALGFIMDSVHEQSGMTTPQKRVATQIAESGPLTVPDIAFALGVSRQFIQTVCNDLHLTGLLEFRDNPKHKRSRLAVLTAAGQQAYNAAVCKENEMIQTIFSGTDGTDVRRATALLDALRRRIEETAF